jgi:hypothetical protein
LGGHEIALGGDQENIIKGNTFGDNFAIVHSAAPTMLPLAIKLNELL